MPDSNNMVEIKGLSKSYNRGKVKAVDNLDLEVRKGEIFGFLGPNGAGKTTTLKMMVGMLNPDSGYVRINGTDIAEQPIEVKSIIGYVPDNTNIYERLTGLEYLNFMADVYRVQEEERITRIRDFLDMFELADAVRDSIKSYSHGMRQKLMLIGALLHDPLLWILDEPMTGLDPKSAKVMKDLMRTHCDKGSSVFFSTHVLEVAERLCDRIGIINDGKLIAIGTMQELRHQKDGTESLENIFLELTEK